MNEDEDTADATVYVYLNAGGGCAYPIERTGLSADDAERLILEGIASINEAAVTAPRIEYGGRVCHDTYVLLSNDPDEQVALDAAYAETWNGETGGLPLGITVMGVPCSKFDEGNDPGGQAAARLRPGFAGVVFKAFQDDDGQMCPRSTFYKVAGVDGKECGTDAPGVAGSDCDVNSDDVECDCIDGDGGLDYQGRHTCQIDDLVNMTGQYTACECLDRGYDAFNLGDGSANPNEPELDSRWTRAG